MSTTEKKDIVPSQRQQDDMARALRGEGDDPVGTALRLVEEFPSLVRIPSWEYGFGNYSKILDAIKLQSPALVKAFFDAGVNPNACTGGKPLEYAMKQPKTAEGLVIVEMFLEHPDMDFSRYSISEGYKWMFVTHLMEGEVAPELEAKRRELFVKVLERVPDKELNEGYDTPYNYYINKSAKIPPDSLNFMVSASVQRGVKYRDRMMTDYSREKFELHMREASLACPADSVTVEYIRGHTSNITPNSKA